MFYTCPVAPGTKPYSSMALKLYNIYYYKALERSRLGIINRLNLLKAEINNETNSNKHYILYIVRLIRAVVVLY